MIFQNEKVSMYLGVVKYQFKDAEDEWDRSWLMARIKLVEKNRVFETIDPCLETGELKYMIKWFRSLPNPTYDELSFTEPNLTFEYIGEKEGGFDIRIHLSYESKPSWCKEEAYSFVINMTNEEREHIICAVEEQQRRFQKR
ncbi:WapI family immunity protein [Bacillus sp. NPDC094077]|uniref:WapI family immunity protein n=1 Tax=Bacillus sp. NPDC094077 TaxID=3390932 RepID=UPI003D08E781